MASFKTIHFGPKWLNIRYFVIWTAFDFSPENGHFLPKNVKKSENGNKTAKNTLGLLFCNNFTEK
jgi:hypothetical protein